MATTGSGSVSMMGPSSMSSSGASTGPSMANKPPVTNSLFPGGANQSVMPGAVGLNVPKAAPMVSSTPKPGTVTAPSTASTGQ
jgi:hypothetical protein